jgi:AraC-like DNA-binding protein
MRTETESWRKPLLDDFLRGIRFQKGQYFRPKFQAPWGIYIEKNCAVFHIVIHGTCWIEINGVTEPMKLSEGDLAVVTRGDAHMIRNPLSTPALNFFGLLKTYKSGPNQALRVGGKGALTSFVCGGAAFETGASNPLIPILPPVLHLKRTEESWLGLMTEQILGELEAGCPEGTEVITRLTEILFIRAVRAYFSQKMETVESGWLAAVRDEQIGRALAMLHGDLQQAWTVDSLARSVALSRSGLAARFKELLGEPPLHYLTRLRINAAAIRLRSRNDKLRAVAAAVGYESVAAFAKAFRRVMGITPGDYRQRASPAGPE